MDDRRLLCRVVVEASRLGVLSEALVATLLRIPLSRARALVGALEALGWIRPVDTGAGAACPCSRCPLARVCPFSRLRGGAEGQRLRTYRVDPAALERCRRLLSGAASKPPG